MGLGRANSPAENIAIIDSEIAARTKHMAECRAVRDDAGVKEHERCLAMLAKSRAEFETQL